METEAPKPSKEHEILLEIREAEKKADIILENAKKERDSIIHGAARNSSNMLGLKLEEIRKEAEQKLIDFREKAKLIREEKSFEARAIIKQMKAKSDKNISKAVNAIIEKMENSISRE